MKNWLSPFLAILGIGILLELLVRSQTIETYILAAPTEILKSLINDRAEYIEGLKQTFTCSLIGFLLSFILGFCVASIFEFIPWAKRAFYPLASFFQTVPIIALAPMMVIWFGFGAPTVIASSFICSLFPVIANMMTGLQKTPTPFLELFQIYQASSWQTFRKLKLPFSLPYLFAGLKISAGLAVIGAVVGEFVGGGGIGAIVDSARTQQRVDKVFAAVILISLMGVFFIAGISILSRAFQKLYEPHSKA